MVISDIDAKWNEPKKLVYFLEAEMSHSWTWKGVKTGEWLLSPWNPEYYYISMLIKRASSYCLSGSYLTCGIHIGWIVKVKVTYQKLKLFNYLASKFFMVKQPPMWGLCKLSAFIPQGSYYLALSASTLRNSSNRL